MAVRALSLTGGAMRGAGVGAGAGSTAGVEIGAGFGGPTNSGLNDAMLGVVDGVAILGAGVGATGVAWGTGA